MNLELQLPPQHIDSRVLAFCERLCPSSRPQYVLVKPQPGAKLLDCHNIVKEKVRVDGGRQVFGWQISEVTGIHLEAQFHSIWESPTGEFLDTSPEEFGQPAILFLEDPHRSYTGTAVPHERFALADIALVERFWELSDTVSSVFHDLTSAGFHPRDPVFRVRLGSVMQEIAAIREKIKKSAQQDVHGNPH